MANYTDTSGHDRPSRFPDSRQNSTNKLASLKARDKSVTSHQRTKNNVWRMDWFSIILLGCYLAFFSFIFPPIFFFAVFFPPACCVTVLMFVHQSLFSLSAFLSSPLVRVSTFKICSRLPRRDVDARYSGYRVTSSSQCSEINSSGKMLLVVRPLSLVHLF